MIVLGNVNVIFLFNLRYETLQIVGHNIFEVVDFLENLDAHSRSDVVTHSIENYLEFLIESIITC